MPYSNAEDAILKVVNDGLRTLLCTAILGPEYGSGLILRGQGNPRYLSGRLAFWPEAYLNRRI